MTGRDPLATHNERVKLFSGFLNAVGLGLIGFAVLRPLTASIDAVTWLSLLWSVGGLALHGLSHYFFQISEKGNAMTAFEIAVPLVAIAIAIVGGLLLRASAKRLDRGDRTHPAE